MRKLSVLALLSAASFLFISGSVCAAVPQLISYQGRLTDNGGLPVAGPVNLTLRLYSVAAAGAAHFTETQNDVAVSAGVFTVLIGANTVGGLPEAALAHPEVWLGVSVNGGAEMVPRTRIVTAPYAFKGQVAEQLVLPNTFDATASVNASGSLSFVPGTTPLILAGQDNNAARPKRMWIGHSAASPNWGIQYRDLASDSLPSDSIEFLAGNTASPRFGFVLGSSDFNAYSSLGERLLNLGPNGSGGGVLRTYDELGNQTSIVGSVGSGGGGFLNIHMNASVWPGVVADGDDGNSGRININKASNATTIRLDGHNGGGGAAGEVSMYDTDGTETVEIVAAEASNQGASMRLRTAAGVSTFDLDADFESQGARLAIVGTQDASTAVGGSGVLVLGETSGANIVMDNNEIIARDNGGASTLHLQAEGGVVAIGLQGVAVPAGTILAVDGKAMFEEVEVQMSQDWPDYVFDEGYDLKPLAELERDIKKLGHLPGMPSADKVKSEGVKLGSMQAALLQKVEELTLHVIGLSKEVETLKAENSSLRKAVRGTARSER